MNVGIDKPGALELAKRSRGTPRIVNRLLKRVRDYAQVRGDGTISTQTVEAALALEGVDEKGLTRLDYRYLKTIIDFYGGGPVGIEAISATLQEESDTLGGRGRTLPAEDRDGDTHLLGTTGVGPGLSPPGNCGSAKAFLRERRGWR